MDQDRRRAVSGLFLAAWLLEGVLRYVKEQPEHHRTHTFQEEYRALLRKHGIDFDERYVWD